MNWFTELLKELESDLTPKYDKPIESSTPSLLTMEPPLTDTSPNFTQSRKKGVIAIVLHISEGTMNSAVSWFLDPSSAVSAHYIVGKDGSIRHLVKESSVAWHAGVVNKPTWTLLQPLTNPNDITIGIEHEGMPSDVWPDAQKNASALLVKQIAQRWGVPLTRNHIIGHREIDSVTRNFCPSLDGKIVDEILALAQAI